ncbi:MAG: lysophospholipid acyltransferase family protein [Chthoniobacteraceae bacterium]
MFYSLVRFFSGRVFHRTIRLRLDLAQSEREGGYVLACTHASHLDPFCVSVVLKRHVRWMARVEFYRSWWSTRLLKEVGAFPVNRQGVPVSAVKTAIRLAQAGEVVGIFPEGEIKRDAESVLRGGRIKRGVCLVSMRSGKPVIPCVVLGSEALLRPMVWRMSKPCRLWVVCGEPIHPPHTGNRREDRRIMAGQIEQAMRSLAEGMRRRPEWVKGASGQPLAARPASLEKACTGLTGERRAG